MIEAGCILIGLITGVVLTGWFQRPTLRRYAESEERLRTDNAAQNEALIALNREVAERKSEAAALEQHLATLRAEAERNAVQRREEIAALETQQRLAFKNLANEILEEKSAQFKQSNRESLELLLKPFRENIDTFRKRVDEVYDKEAQQRFSLKEEIHQLNEMNHRMSEEANNLTKALKGNSKVQGDWGEMVLETILESTNLQRGIHYQTQENLKDAEGHNLRPDVIVNLPDKKRIVIDAKVSLTAYVAYTESTTADEASRAIKDHLRSVRSHVDELGSKQYQTLVVGSPDFVIMFIPNEPAFLLALQQEPTLWSDAYNKKVIISSPTNLFAQLKLVDDLWKRDKQNRNTLDIAKAGSALYDKFVGFTNTLLDLGKSLSTASDKYEQAVKQLHTGKGNLVGQAEKMRKLGLKASKQFANQMADDQDTTHDDGTPLALETPSEDDRTLSESAE